jgi:hypothetical protein
MPVQPIVSIDDGGMKRKLEKLAYKSGVTIQFICWDQLRLWTQDMMNKTAPKALKQGRATVTRDVTELFEPAETAAAFTFWKNRLAQQGSDLIQYTKRGKMRLTKQSAKYAAASQMRQIHKKARTRGGGVSRRKVNKHGNDIAFRGKLIVPKSEFNKFRREQQAKVGFLKAGWAPALEFWARKSNATAKVPSWVARQVKKVGYPGGKIDEKGNGFIEAVNAVTYANSRISQDHLVELTKAGRQRDLTNGAFKRMDDLAKRFNAGTI